MVYRLSDTVNALPRRFCAAEDPAQIANEGLSQYRKLLGEIRQDATAVMVSDRFEISNIAEGILSTQLNLPLALLGVLPSRRAGIQRAA